MATVLVVVVFSKQGRSTLRPSIVEGLQRRQKRPLVCHLLAPLALTAEPGTWQEGCGEQKHDGSLPGLGDALRQSASRQLCDLASARSTDALRIALPPDVRIGARCVIVINLC